MTLEKMKKPISTKNIIFGLVFLVIIGGFLYFYIGPFSPAENISGAAMHQLPPKGSRVLIVAPHCDDETLGVGILLNRLIRAGNRDVKVVIVTNGDGFALAAREDFFTLQPSSKEYTELGLQRQKESIDTLKKLGLPEKNIIFLGYPDGGIAHLWTEFWDKNKGYVSRTTQTDVSPYKNSFNKKVLYTGENLLQDLTKVIVGFKPTHIYYPHPNDRHPDHWGVNAFTKYVLYQQKMHISENLYLVHRGNWPKPKMALTYKKLEPPFQLVNQGTAWSQFPFHGQEAQLKKTAILQYRTQVRAMRNFLLAFVRSSELFGKYTDFVLVKSDHNNKLTANKMKAIIDPVNDLISTDIEKAADIQWVNSYLTDSNWVVEIVTVKPVNKTITYRLHARIFEEDNAVKRFDLLWSQDKLRLLKYASNSITDIPGLSTKVTENKLVINIPLNQIKGARGAMLNADTGIGSYNLDKTAWRLLVMPKN